MQTKRVRIFAFQCKEKKLCLQRQQQQQSKHQQQNYGMQENTCSFEMKRKDGGRESPSQKERQDRDE